MYTRAWRWMYYLTRFLICSQHRSSLKLLSLWWFCSFSMSWCVPCWNSRPIECILFPTLALVHNLEVYQISHLYRHGISWSNMDFPLPKLLSTTSWAFEKIDGILGSTKRWHPFLLSWYNGTAYKSCVQLHFVDKPLKLFDVNWLGHLNNGHMLNFSANSQIARFDFILISLEIWR